MSASERKSEENQPAGSGASSKMGPDYQGANVVIDEPLGSSAFSRMGADYEEWNTSGEERVVLPSPVPPTKQ